MVDPADEPLAQDPLAISDPIDRARLVFTQWHVDEVCSPAEALVYADRLLERLAQFGLTIVKRPG